LGEDEASRLAAEEVSLTPGRASVEEMSLVVVTDRHLGQRGDRLAWRLRIRAPQGEAGWWKIWVDAHTGEVLEVKDLIYHTQTEGRVLISAEPMTQGDPQLVYPAPSAKVVLERPGEPLAAEYTDLEGNFSFGDREESDLSYVSLLEGRYFKIFNESGGSDVTPVLEIPVEGTGRDTLLWSDFNSEVAARDVYVHANIAHNTTMAWDPSFTPGWPLPMPAVVERAENCNAYFDGVRIVFYSQGGGCASTGRIADVVYHEYAHGITYSLYLPFDAPSDMHEAYSDYYGATLTNQSLIGVGFFGPGTSLRNVDNTMRWPIDVSGEPHHDGLILAGAFWDLRESLGAEITDYLYHFHRYGLPMTYNEAFLETLILDDDDGNIFNGTPHFDAITSAFLNHGIGDLRVEIQHTPVPDTEETGVDIEVSANILSLFGLEPDSLLIYYRGESHSPFNELPLQPNPEGGTRAFEVTIPGQPEDSVIEYYLFAADTSGHRATLPSGAPDTLFTFFVGRDTIPPVLVPEPLPHATADQDSFLVEITASDNTARMESVEMRLRKPSDGAIASSFLGLLEDNLYGGYVLPGPLTVGDRVLYRILATDAAAEPNTTTWPRFEEWASFEIRPGWFTDLESTAGDFQATGDWEWGVPEEDKGRARSGRKVWATRLELVYSNQMNSTLTTALDLTGWDRATLEFWHSFETERDWDGGRLLVSTDGGNTFRTIRPSQGYNHGNVAVFQGEGYSGSSNGWRKVEVPLDIYLGEVIHFRFQFAADQSVVNRGWMLDDVRLISRQTLGAPIGVSAESGLPEGIPVSWRPPRGIATSLDQFIGYNVFRGTAPGEYGEQPINPSPMRSPAYLDAGVEPGVTYYYVVTALYDEGESERSREVSGTSFQALLALGFDTLRVALEKDSIMDTTLFVANAGFGNLDFQTFLADTGQDLSNVRLLYEVGMGSLERPILLSDDPQDASMPPDISAVLAGDDGERLTLRIREHEAHGDPTEDFTLVFSLDTDLNQDTGLSMTNQGADFIVLVGALPLSLTQGQIPAFIVDGNDFNRIVGIPDELDLAAEQDSISVGFLLNNINHPDRFTVQALTAKHPPGAGGFEFIDTQPDTLEASWLTRDPRAGTATPESPSTVTLYLDATGLTDGIYRGRCLLKTNDLSRPEAAIGVELTVGTGISFLASVEFTSLMEGMEIVWAPPPGSDVSAFKIFRRHTGEPDEIQLGGDHLPDEEGRYRLVDRGVRTGESYEYRFDGLQSDGGTITFGTVTQPYNPEAPIAFMALDPKPTPFHSNVALRFGIPREGKLLVAVYDVQGRKVRTLRSGTTQPGVYEDVWNGRDSKGNSAASGVYFALIQWERIKKVKRLVLTR
jgi:hypothetical protein